MVALGAAIDWTRTRLKNVATINARALGNETPQDYQFRYLEISNVNDRGIISEEAISGITFEDAPSRARRVVQDGDTVISSVRPNLQASAFIGKAGGNLVASTGFFVVSPLRHKLDDKFTYYALVAGDSRQRLEAAAKGVGYPAVDDRDFSTLNLTLPPLTEQRRIALYLDNACAAIDGAIWAKRRQLEVLDGLRKSIIHNAVTRGLNENVRLKATGIDWLDGIPEGWRVTRLKNLASIRYGLGQPPQEKDDGVPMIRATNIDEGNIIENNLLRVDPSALPIERQPYLKEGEIIVVRSGALTGDSAIISKKYAGAVAGYDMVVTVKSADPKFVSYSLLSSYVLDGQLLLMTLRAAQPHLNAEELGSILVVIPETIDEQKRIAQYIEAKTGQIDGLKGNLTTQISTLEQYRKSLIHECVTGKRRIAEADLAKKG
jgi:type I restriction enzyme S subunit